MSKHQKLAAVCVVIVLVPVLIILLNADQDSEELDALMNAPAETPSAASTGKPTVDRFELARQQMKDAGPQPRSISDSLSIIKKAEASGIRSKEFFAAVNQAGVSLGAALRGNEKHTAIFVEKLQVMAPELATVHIHQNEETAEWKSVKVCETRHGFDAVRFKVGGDEDSDLFIAIVSPHKIFYWGMVAMSGKPEPMQNPKVVPIELKSVPASAEHGVIFRTVVGSGLIPGKEYILWFRFNSGDVADLHYVARAVPVGSVEDWNSAEGIVKAIGEELFETTNE